MSLAIAIWDTLLYFKIALLSKIANPHCLCIQTINDSFHFENKLMLGTFLGSFPWSRMFREPSRKRCPRNLWAPPKRNHSEGQEKFPGQKIQENQDKLTPALAVLSSYLGILVPSRDFTIVEIEFLFLTKNILLPQQCVSFAKNAILVTEPIFSNFRSWCLNIVTYFISSG